MQHACGSYSEAAFSEIWLNSDVNLSTGQLLIAHRPTGPVTILNWSFPRKDISRRAQAFQLALALREEVADLEKAGCEVIQVNPNLEP